MKKLRNVLFWSGIFLVILTYIVIKPLENLDEMWNFNVARCIANGLIPYKEISMVSTPLLGFLTAIFLRIFGTEMFITRVLAAVLATINLGILYRICIKMKIPNSIGKLLILVVMSIMKDYYCLDYNMLIMTLGLIILLLEIKSFEQENKNKKIHIIIGIVSGLAICTKQSIGLLISVVVVLNQLFFIRNKESFKAICKNIVFRIIGIVIPVIIFIGYLFITGAFSYFIDYCVLGMKTFSNKISYSDLLKSDNLIIKIFSIAVPVILAIAIILNIVLRILNKEDKLLFLITIYCLPIFAISYPISDNIHFFISITPCYILPFYGIGRAFNKIKCKNFKYVLEFLEITSFIFIILFTGYTEIKYREELSALSKYRALNHFSNIIVDQKLEKMVKDVDNYIVTSEKDVYILDSNAALYMIPLDRYNKNYDMFLRGNLGSGGEEKQIRNIEENSENTRYLILNNNYNLNWQTPKEVINYIKERFVKSGTVGIYDIYEKEQVVEYEPEE